MTRFKELDPVLHSQLRLAVVSLLMGVESAEFTFIREQTGATSGNLSVQITKLKEAGYIEVTKSFNNNYPQTLCRITPEGRRKFIEYVNTLKDYLNTENL
jgi:DNA-binding MarR family transcriptional regulator